MTPQRHLTLRIVVSIVGVALLLGGLFADTLGLSASGTSTGPFLIMLVGGFMLLVGLLGKNFASFYKGLGLILLNTLVFILLIEIGFGVIAKLISAEDEPEVTGWRSLSYYHDKEWGNAYWDEDNISREFVYDPFVGWKSPMMQGSQITVNEARHRVTPGADCRADSYTVFVFGGSTIFGTGSPDWGTIPAYLQERLSTRTDRPVCVVNFGQLGHVAAQEEIELMRQLQVGNIPDVVIFYNGVNDVYSAYLYGTTYSVYGLEDIAAKFNGTIPEESLWDKLVDELQDNSYTYKVIKSFSDNTEEPSARSEEETRNTYTKRGLTADVLADEIVENVSDIHNHVLRLSEIYGFDFIHIWQPLLLLGEKPLAEEERIHIETAEPTMLALYHAVYQRMETASLENFYVVTDVFDGIEAFIYIDRFHLVPEGNELVAARILSLLQDKLP